MLDQAVWDEYENNVDDKDTEVMLDEYRNQLMIVSISFLHYIFAFIVLKPRQRRISKCLTNRQSAFLRN